jgi:hypothetical protein
LLIYKFAWPEYDIINTIFVRQILLPVTNSVSLLSTAGRKVFRDFLRCEYSEENILFWLACEELKKETNPDVVEEKARYIYEDYISILSPKEVIMKRILFVMKTNQWYCGLLSMLLLYLMKIEHL